MKPFAKTIVASFASIFTVLLFGGCGESTNKPEIISGGLYPEDGYLIDENAIYYIWNVSTENRRMIIEGADPQTFEVIGDGYSKDKSRMYWWDTAIENSDPDSFIILENGFEKDKENVYFREHILEDADPDTFEIISHETANLRCNDYGKDKNGVWNSTNASFGENPFLERDPNTFELIDRECVFSKDKNGVYLEDEKLENIDPKEFVYLGNGYVSYDDIIYHSHDPRETYAMPGPNYKLFEVDCADAETFEPLMTLYARDKNNIYYGGLILNEEELVNEHEEFAKLIGYSKENLDPITVLQKFYKHEKKIKSKALQIEFDFPDIFESCIEEEVDMSKIEPIYDEDPNGHRLTINCGYYELFIDAITDDYQVYEAHDVPYSYHPSHDELYELCSKDAHCEYYTILNNNNKEVIIYIMDTHWQWDPGEGYILSAYIPLDNESHYNTARISMKIGELPDYSDENYSEIKDEYLDKVVNKDLEEKDLERIRNFEDILSSIK
jgi:DKNYY family